MAGGSRVRGTSPFRGGSIGRGARSTKVVLPGRDILAEGIGSQLSTVRLMLARRLRRRSGWLPLVATCLYILASVPALARPGAYVGWRPDSARLNQDFLNCFDNDGKLNLTRMRSLRLATANALVEPIYTLSATDRDYL